MLTFEKFKKRAVDMLEISFYTKAGESTGALEINFITLICKHLTQILAKRLLVVHPANNR